MTDLDAMILHYGDAMTSKAVADARIERKRANALKRAKPEDPLREDRIREERIHGLFERMGGIAGLAEKMKQTDRKGSAGLFARAADGYLAMIMEMAEKPFYCSPHLTECATRDAVDALERAGDAMSFLDEQFTAEHYLKAARMGSTLARGDMGRINIERAEQTASICGKALTHIDPESLEGKEMKNLMGEMKQIVADRPEAFRGYTRPARHNPLDSF